MELLNIEQTAVLLGITARALRSRITNKSKSLPEFHRVSGFAVFVKQDVLDYLESQGASHEPMINPPVVKRGKQKV